MHTRLLGLMLLVALTAVACSGGDDAPFEADVIVVGDDQEVTPIIASSELVVGVNRFVLGILGPDGRPIVDARVNLRFFDLNGATAVEKLAAETASRVPAREAGIEEQVDHIHADGARHTHFNVGEAVGVYTALVSFDRAGVWGVAIEVGATRPKLKRTLQVRFTVLEKGTVPAVGEPAPRSRNLTVADVTDVAEIDSSGNPSPEMHTATIADTIAAGRPALVLFAVPGYCESRLCGPELEIMRKLLPRFRERAEFIHVEFYKEPGNPERVRADAAAEWNLRTEPWFFVIDGEGLIAARFEGPTSLQELEEALERVTGPGG